MIWFTHRWFTQGFFYAYVLKAKTQSESNLRAFVFAYENSPASWLTPKF